MSALLPQWPQPSELVQNLVSVPESVMLPVVAVRNLLCGRSVLNGRVELVWTDWLVSRG
jgi:hypothetical protein